MINNQEQSKISGSKVLPLSEAVKLYIKPKMTLHIGGGIGGAGAAICEIIRRFYGTSPNFTLVQSTITGHAINLLACNLVKRVIFSACIDISNRGRPSKVMQKKWAEHSLELENWTLCSLQQRLLAGALGIGFIPTRSISGSQMAIDNQQFYREIENPFNEREPVGVLKALNPDISIVHGCAADAAGNTILGIPYGDDIWGSLASTSGVLVTVEKIVPAEIIKKHAALVKIPGHLVKAVSMAPLGVHPFSLANPGLSDFEGYESDVDFLQGLHQAFEEPDKLKSWINEWVLDCPSPEDYLKKLGMRKIMVLQPVRQTADKPIHVSALNGGVETYPEYSSEEMMLIAAAREIVRRVMDSQLKVVLLGAGSRSVAVLLAYHELHERGYGLEIITGNGQYGCDPQPGEIGLQNLAGVYSAKMVMDTITSQGILIGGQNNLCLGVLGAGQIDKFGDINSTLTSEGQFLVGSGGANDVGNAREVMVILNQSRDRFVEKMQYVTCPGNRVTTVVSDMGIFKKRPGEKELRLMACLPDTRSTILSERIKQVRKHCSWTLKTAGKVADVPAPSREELVSLRRLMRA